MKYGELTLGQVEAIVNKMGGMEGVKRFLSGKTVVKEEDRQFKVWRTIKLGTPGLKTAEDFRRAIKDNGMKIGDWANDILGQPGFTVADEETEIDLVCLTVAELGFKDGARRDKIYTEAQKFGLQLCPAEVGPQLRLQYKDQSSGEWIFVAMDPITASGGGLRVFRVGRDGRGLWLDGDYGNPGSFWGGGDRWVFARRK